MTYVVLYAEFFARYPWVFILLVAFLSAMIGSFLNVVIYRLPIMLERQWQTQAKEILTIKQDHSAAPFGLAHPNSHCPHCQHKITLWHNIPILSYFFLAAKCANCQAPIPMRYMLVELISTLVGGVLAWALGFDLTLLAVLILVFSCVVLFMIDLEHHLLPDQITLPLLWIGLLVNMVGMFTSLQDAVLGAIFGYLILWGIYWIFKFATKKEGMGYGDFKLLACFGAWLGWPSLLLILLMSSLIGILSAVLLKYTKGHDYNKPFAFGPSLIIAGLITLFYGDALTNAYFQLLL